MANLGAKETAWCFLEAEGLKRPEGVQRHQQKEKGPWGGARGRGPKMAAEEVAAKSSRLPRTILQRPLEENP